MGTYNSNEVMRLTTPIEARRNASLAIQRPRRHRRRTARSYRRGSRGCEECGWDDHAGDTCAGNAGEYVRGTVMIRKRWVKRYDIFERALSWHIVSGIRLLSRSQFQFPKFFIRTTPIPLTIPMCFPGHWY